MMLKKKNRKLKSQAGSTSLRQRGWCYRVALLSGWLIGLAVVYGVFFGFGSFRVRHIECVSADVPAAFDGYRIVQFSDAHVGTLNGPWRSCLQRAVDSINAQRADMIAFVGDLQNVHPQEIEKRRSVLGQLNAKDGVFSVLGNHDYDMYMHCSKEKGARLCRRTQAAERQLGWTLLMNEHRIVRRGGDSIVVAGMENWGSVKRMPRRGDVKKTLAGLAMSGEAPFILMLQHDPTAWRRKILPECGAQLTLSGHTHGGQFSLLGWSPASLAYDEWGGMTQEGRRMLNVSTGLFGLIPFRLGMPGEIVVITLRRAPN